MRKYHGMRILILCFCILISVSGCSAFRQTKTCTTFSDASRIVSFVSGSELNSMGIVLDNREFLQCDYEGSVMNDVVFDTDISFLDMWGYYVLIGFEDNHIEIYYMDSDETQKLCEYSFDNEISQAEINGYSAHCRVTVLLNNGELLTNTDDELGKLRQIAENIDSFSYNHGSIMYVNRNREVRLYSYYGHQYICEELQKLHDVIRVDAISFSSSQNGDFAFVLYREGDVFFVQYNTSFSDSFFVISEKKVEVEDYYVSTAVPSSVVYRENGNLYYEGPTHDQRRIRGYDKARLKISIPEGYEIHVVCGGVVYYNEHEVKTMLIN